MFRKLLFICCALAVTNAFAQVVINEVLYDTQGTDDTSILFVELFGPAGTNLAGWSLIGYNGNGGAAYVTVNLTGSIPQDGYFVVGGSGTANVDQISATDWQNGGSSQGGEDCDGIELRNAGGGVADALCYGTCAGGHVCNGEGASAPDYNPPSSGPNKSLARIPDHGDTQDNSVDFQVSDDITPGLPNSGSPCDPLTTTIAAVRENDGNGLPVLNGQFVIVSGVVNVDNYTLDSLTESSFYVQDEDAGVNVFRGSVPAGISEGDQVTVSGWVGSFNGLTEILSSGSGNCLFEVEVTGEGSAPDPALLQCNSFFEAYEGMLARIENVTIVGGDPWPAQGQFANIQITDGNGILTLRIDNDTDIPGTPAPQGTFNVEGIITQFDNSSPYSDGYQITARYPRDIITTAADDPRESLTASEFALLGSYPNPFNSTARIHYEVGGARELTISITDILGREVLAQKLTNLTPGTHDFTWTPSGATGLYLVRLSGESSVQTAKLLYLR